MRLCRGDKKENEKINSQPYSDSLVGSCVMNSLCGSTSFAGNVDVLAPSDPNLGCDLTTKTAGELFPPTLFSATVLVSLRACLFICLFLEGRWRGRRKPPCMPISMVKGTLYTAARSDLHAYPTPLP